MASQNRWTQPLQPPPPLFVGAAERNFVKQINDEVIEKVIGQQILYFPVDVDRTNYNFYGEALEKNFLSPVRAYCLTAYMDSERVQGVYGYDNVRMIESRFNDRRISQDQDLFLRIGDFVQYDETFFEIIDVAASAKNLFGQDTGFADGYMQSRSITCREARLGLFDPGSVLGGVNRGALGSSGG